MSDNRFFSEKHDGIHIGQGTTVIVDSWTGVQYLYAYWGNTGGLTLLVDRDGKPLLSDDPRVLR